MKSNILIRALAATLMLALGNFAYAGKADEKTEQQTQVQERVNINEADAETLQRVLNGVGRNRAEAIVAYREANGKFYSAEELTAVRGIGLSIMRKNEDKIVVK